MGILRRLGKRRQHLRRFESKVAIVTGAGCVGSGWGNGRAMAVQLVQECAREFRQFFLTEYEKWGRIVKAAGVKADGIL